MLTVLVIDVSRAFIQYTEVNKALQNGARYAVVDTYGTLNFESIEPARQHVKQEQKTYRQHNATNGSHSSFTLSDGFSGPK